MMEHCNNEISINKVSRWWISSISELHCINGITLESSEVSLQLFQQCS